MPDFDLIAWTGMFGPANLPADVVKTLSDELGKVLADAEVRKRLEATGAEVQYQSAAQFTTYLKSELVKWTSLIKASGIEPQ